MNVRSGWGMRKGGREGVRGERERLCFERRQSKRERRKTEREKWSVETEKREQTPYNEKKGGLGRYKRGDKW